MSVNQEKSYLYVFISVLSLNGFKNCSDVICDHESFGLKFFFLVLFNQRVISAFNLS